MARGKKTQHSGTSAWTILTTIAAGLIIALALWYWIGAEGAIGEDHLSDEQSEHTTSGLTIDAAQSIEALDVLRVVEPGSMDGYDRAAFGPAWADVDANGCDTRNDILRRDLVDITYADSKECTVLSGTLNDLYTGTDIEFMRGRATSSAVQIDHIVALADAWKKGASAWDDDTRRQFANDPVNLRAVDGPSNSSKGASDAAQWLPPNTAHHCEYVAAQIHVKSNYDVAVTSQEKDAMTHVLASC